MTQLGLSNIAEMEYGKRLLPTIIDSYAEQKPGRVYASIPVSNDDLSLGFKDISYLEFARAIDKASC